MGVVSYSTWYHGTARKNVERILAEGLGSKHFGTDWQEGWPGLPYHVMSKTRHQATGWAAEGRGAILTLRVSDDVRGEYLTCDDACYWCHGGASGLIKLLPARMIAAVESV
jgi:hypothetical protein